MTKSVGYLSEHAGLGRSRIRRTRLRLDLLFPVIMAGAVFLIARAFFGF